MKFGLLVMLCLLLPGFAQAAEETPKPPSANGPVEELTQMAICTANEIILMQHRAQVGLTITAQTDNPQLAALAESFNTLANANHEQIGTYVKVIKEAIVPQITSAYEVKENEVLDKANKLTNVALNKINAVLDNAQPREKQIALERELINTAARCETLAGKVGQRHTM